jgi:tetratricopeptide (TPR) repeat protein
MVKNQAITKSEQESGLSFFRKTGKKMIILLVMIIMAIIIIVYKGNNEYWSDQFVAYNQYLFGISMVSLILIILVVIVDFKRIFKFEFLGTLIFGIGALITSLFYARVYFNLGFGEEGLPFILAGGVVMAIGTLFLMRTGGFIGASLVGVIIALLLSFVHMVDSGTLIQFDNNALQLLNLTIVCFIIGFLLLVYQELKFFYLAKLMREERELRGKKDYKMALTYCDKALRIYPYFVTGWNNKGNVLFNLGKKKEAINCYKKALEINPNYSPAKRNLRVMSR